MANKTITQVPIDIENPIVLKRFLSKLVEQLDIILGNRGTSSYLTGADLNDTATVQMLSAMDAELRTAISAAVNNAKVALSNEISLKTTNLKQTAIEEPEVVEVTASTTYAQTEVQQLADNIATLEATLNNILVALRAASILES